MGLRPTQEDETCDQSLLGFVSGHDFSRAVKGSLKGGL